MPKRGDIAGDRLGVACIACRRHGSYRLDGLMQRFGPEISTLDLLRALATVCRHQRGLGAKVARRYESQCLATLRLPKALSLEPPVPPGTPFAIEVWDERAAWRCGALSSTRSTARSLRSRRWKRLSRRAK
jgi:hypothetical protein